MSLEITEIEIKEVNTTMDYHLASVRVTLDDALVLDDMGVRRGKQGLFVTYPLDYTGRQVFHTITKELHDMIESQVLNKYNKQVDN